MLIPNSFRRIIFFYFDHVLILCATSTLATGVNLPAYLLILFTTNFYKNPVDRLVRYSISSILQMLGRAGRPQYGTGAKVMLANC